MQINYAFSGYGCQFQQVILDPGIKLSFQNYPAPKGTRIQSRSAIWLRGTSNKCLSESAQFWSFTRTLKWVSQPLWCTAGWECPSCVPGIRSLWLAESKLFDRISNFKRYSKNRSFAEFLYFWRQEFPSAPAGKKVLAGFPPMHPSGCRWIQGDPAAASWVTINSQKMKKNPKSYQPSAFFLFINMLLFGRVHEFPPCLISIVAWEMYVGSQSLRR